MKNIVGKYYKSLVNVFPENVKSRELSSEEYDFFYKEAEEGKIYLAVSDNKVFVVCSEGVYPLTDGLLEEKAFSQLLEILTDENRYFSKDASRLLYDVARFFYPEIGLDAFIQEFYYRYSHDVKRLIFFVHLCVCTAESVFSILFKNGFVEIGYGVLCGKINLSDINLDGKNPSEIMLMRGFIPQNMLKRYDSIDGFALISKNLAKAKRIAVVGEKIFSEVPFYTFTKRDIDFLNIIEKYGYSIFMPGEIRYAYELLSPDKFEEKAKMKAFVLKRFNLNETIISMGVDGNLELAFELANCEEKINKCITARMEALSGYSFSNTLFSISAATSLGDFALARKHLHNDILSYANEYSRGRTDIFFVRNRKQNIIAFVEVSKGKQVNATARHIKNENDFDIFLNEWMRRRNML